MSAPRCGVVGLGNMGSGIAANLHKAGLLAAVWDTNPSAVARLADSQDSASCDGVALATCDILLLVVPGSKQIGALLDDGTLGLAKRGACKAGSILLDLTTSKPDDTLALAKRAEALGYSYVDAGMSGGAAGAANGQLALMVGADGAVFETLQPVFSAIASQVFHLGPVGTGHTMKLVHNMICHTIFLATSEGCRAAEKAGIALEDCLAVLNAGNARSFISERRLPDHVASGTFDGRSQTSNLAKDMAMARALFDKLGQASPYVQLSDGLLEAALQNQLGEEDFTRLYQHYDALADQD